jgi:hypothetical protein
MRTDKKEQEEKKEEEISVMKKQVIGKSMHVFSTYEKEEGRRTSDTPHVTTVYPLSTVCCCTKITDTHIIDIKPTQTTRNNRSWQMQQQRKRL